MKRIWLVIKFEFIKTVMRRSFMLTLILTPLIPFGIIYIYSVVEGGSLAETAPSPVVQIIEGEKETKPEGLVDFSGLVQEFPQDQKTTLRLYPNESAAKEALELGEISAIYILDRDYLKSGKVTYIRPDFNPLSAIEQSDALKETIQYNLLKDNPDLLMRLEKPINLEIKYLSETPARNPEAVETFFFPYIIALVFYIIIFGSSSLLLNSVTEEKQSRVIEILMTSITPLQMLAGKVVALGAAGILQMVAWAGIGTSLYSLAGRDSALLENLGEISTGLIIWGIVYFVLGFAIYATLMAGLGALVTNLREASQASIVIMLPLIAPLVFTSALASRPNSSLSVAFSLFPLTAPVSMPMRLSAGIVPVWQILLSIVLLIGAAILVIRSVAGMFRAQHLLSGQAFRLGLFFKALAGKA